jgi:hypothetical protein
MPRNKSVQDPSLLQAALEGLEAQKLRIEEQIGQVRVLLGLGGARRGRPPANAVKEPGKKRTLSPAARKRIALAQKRRWAQFRKTNAESAAE